MKIGVIKTEFGGFLSKQSQAECSLACLRGTISWHLRASFMRKSTLVVSPTHVAEQTWYYDVAQEEGDGTLKGVGNRYKPVGLALCEDVMGSVSGTVAEIIRSDSRIIKERISTRRLPRIISGVKILPEDPACHCFRVWGIPWTVGNVQEYRYSNVAQPRYFCVIKWNSSVVRAVSRAV